jgi:hypothetical protein
MQYVVESPLPLDAVEVSALPDGETTSGSEKNIIQENRTDEAGVTQMIYTANEVYLRLDEAIDAVVTATRFDELWALGAGYDPQTQRAPTADQQWKADVENALVELADMIAGGE